MSNSKNSLPMDLQELARIDHRGDLVVRTDLRAGVRLSPITAEVAVGHERGVEAFMNGFVYCPACK